MCVGEALRRLVNVGEEKDDDDDAAADDDNNSGETPIIRADFLARVHMLRLLAELHHRRSLLCDDGGADSSSSPSSRPAARRRDARVAACELYTQRLRCVERQRRSLNRLNNNADEMAAAATTTAVVGLAPTLLMEAHSDLARIYAAFAENVREKEAGEAAKTT